MGLFDSLKGMFGGKKGDDPMAQMQDVVDQGKQWVDQQGGMEGLQQKAGDVVEQVKDAAANVDIPGTDVDDKIKDALGVNNENNSQQQ